MSTTTADSALSHAHGLGWLHTLAASVILSFYSVIAGWVLSRRASETELDVGAGYGP